MHYYAFRGAKMLRSPALLERTSHELGGGKLRDLRNLLAGNHFGFKEHFAPCCADWSILNSNNSYEFIMTDQQYSDRLSKK